MESPAVMQTTAPPDTELALIQRIIADAKSGRLQLPSLPDLAFKVRTAVNDPRRSVADIARLIQFDPALAARLIQIANSPLYRGIKKFDNCHSAITRMGIEIIYHAWPEAIWGEAGRVRAPAVSPRRGCRRRSSRSA